MGAGIRYNSLFAVSRYDWYCGQPLSNAAVARLSLAARHSGYAIQTTLRALLKSLDRQPGTHIREYTALECVWT